MIDKTNLLKEILENNPELEDKKKSIKKLIDVLVKNNPKIKADKEFKKNLRSRLDAIIESKDTSMQKLTFFTVLIQVFSLAFAIGGYFYFIEGVDFFNKDKVTINKITTPEISNDDMIQDELEEIGDMFSQELDSVIQKTQAIEDNQVVNLFGDSTDSEINIRKTDSNDIQVESMMLKSNIKTFAEPSINSFSEIEISADDNSDEDIVSDLKIDETKKEISFEEFCTNNMGDLLNIDIFSICIVEGKQCMKENYKNGICEFEEIE